jgi:hypothetical protein
MATATSLPIAVSPEAQQYITSLGLESVFEKMLEHTRQFVPGLAAVDVSLAHDPEGQDEARVVILASMAERGLDYDPTEDEWARWMIRTFPPDVFRHFVMLTAYGAVDGR